MESAIVAVRTKVCDGRFSPTILANKDAYSRTEQKKNKSTRRAKETCNDGNPLWTNVCAVQRGMRINTLAPHSHVSELLSFSCARVTVNHQEQHSQWSEDISLRWSEDISLRGSGPFLCDGLLHTLAPDIGRVHAVLVHAVLPCYTKYHGFAPELVCPSPKPAGPVELKVRRMSIQHVQASYTAISTSSAASIAEEWTHSHPNGTRGRRPSWSSTRSELALQEHKT
ncbi:hypothetical protein BJ912DRAFT_256078 [Pholiota molesta]|nr:hypothetical protein BJ912DRAFT_256078 [Pholiota molesta]